MQYSYVNNYYTKPADKIMSMKAFMGEGITRSLLTLVFDQAFYKLLWDEMKIKLTLISHLCSVVLTIHRGKFIVQLKLFER
jgi:hypothetical protein